MGVSRRFCALALVAGLTGVTACGGDDSAADGGQVQSAEEASATSVSSVEQRQQALPTSMAEWEALWEEERAAVVARIKENKWGKTADGRTVNGPEGFTI